MRVQKCSKSSCQSCFNECREVDRKSVEKLKQKSSAWDMSIINSTESDDELYSDPSASGRSLNKPSSRMDMKEKMNRSNSSLLTLDLLQDDGGEEKQEGSLAKSGFSLATEYIDEDEEEKGIRFNPALDVREYVTRDEYTEEEFFRCFYTSLETNLMLESRNKVIDKINRGKMKNQDSLRGLEYWVESTSTQIDRRVDSMIQRVMDEQDIQIEGGYDDPMKLAELSLSVSIESMAVALKIASRDAKVARKAYRLMFEKHELEMDGQQTMKSNGTATTAALSSVVLPESLELKSSKTKKAKEDKDIDDSGRSTRSVSSRKSTRSTRSTGSKKIKKRNSDSNSSKKSSKRNTLKKQSLDSSSRSVGSHKKQSLDSSQRSQRSVGSAKSTSSKKSKKKKKKDKVKEEDDERSVDSIDSDAGVSHKKMKKRKSGDSIKKKRRSSSSDIKVKKKESDDASTASSKKSSRRSSGSEIKVKDKRRSSATDVGSNNKDKRRSSAPVAVKRSSSSSKQLTSSLSSEEGEYLEKNQKSEQQKYYNSLSSSTSSFPPFSQKSAQLLAKRSL